MRCARGVRLPSRRLWVLLVALLAVFAPQPARAQEILKVGYMARDGEGPDDSEFRPAIDAVNQELKSRSRKQRLSLVRLSYEEVLPEVRAKQVDFLIVDPELYVQIEDLGAVALASLRRKYQGQEVATYGGVIFGVDDKCTVDRATGKLKGRVAAVATNSHAGFKLQKAELAQRGISWNEGNVKFLGNHLEVVDNVVANRAQCGFVRTGTLEQWAKKYPTSKYKLSRFQPLFVDGQGRNSQYIMSTSAYAEWPFVALAHVDASVVEVVDFVLLTMRPFANPRFKDETLRWGYPVSYAAYRKSVSRSPEAPAPPPVPKEEPEEPEVVEAPAAAPAPATDVAAAAPAPEPEPVEVDIPAGTPEPPSPPPPPFSLPQGPQATLAGILGLVLMLSCVILYAAYSVGRSVGVSRALGAGRRLSTRDDIDHPEID